MCGIVGYVGSRNATPFLLDGLSALEYRGYDSAGIYVEGKGVVRRAGKVATLREAVPEGFSGTLGIAHTRWATHGPPVEKNAHPHTDASGTVSIVHNGIIENYADLKAELASSGVAFHSDTDTEVLANLIYAEYGEGVLLEDAVAKALSRVRGTYGLVAASVREPGKLVAARFSSPVMLGIGDGEYYIASDATPVLRHTRDVVYLDDGDIAVLTENGYDIRTLAGESRSATVETLEWDLEAAQKKGYEHFMLKEMMEIPEALENTLRGRLLMAEGSVRLGGLIDILPTLQEKSRVIITGCGSASYAGRVGELMLEEFAGIPTEVELGSELRYRKNTMNPADTILIAVSQSGETLDTIEAIREAKRNGVTTLGVVNVVGSSIARETDAGVYNHAGPEISVASTKAMISQMAVFAMISILFARGRGMSVGEGQERIEELAKLPDLARSILKKSEEIRKLSQKYKDAENAFYLGRKYQFPIALEGAIKLKEISYIHAEGYASGEMKHGPIALIEPSFLSVVLAPDDSLYEKSKSNIQEIKARGGKVLAITTEGKEEDLRELADDIIAVPKTHEAFLPILTAIPVQLFAYHVAHARDLPIDQPRNLAKSVTVE
ncbi:MAG: glutamine--fructose-6-phosphate transaminase (isomerizing) [Candidatus Pacebacteria bacterium]|nr:glutamine--fructose-6-phosphate transaminase (isomerizing) [Candidatus Paceibacterota bacterium]MBP9840247.1 glutamine--fructose-6-phosphate transaminase (isomerizing) [Candidatus Paceibacterota bacterium]